MKASVEKAIQALAYLAGQHHGKLDKLYAIKLLWVADRQHLRRHARTVVGSPYRAMAHGPVADTVLEVCNFRDLDDAERSLAERYLAPADLQETGKPDALALRAMPELDLLSETDLEALNFALHVGQQRTGWELATWSHHYPEWREVRRHLQDEWHKTWPMDARSFFKNPEGDALRRGLDGQDPFATPQAHLDRSLAIFEAHGAQWGT